MHMRGFTGSFVDDLLLGEIGPLPAGVCPLTFSPSVKSKWRSEVFFFNVVNRQSRRLPAKL